ncbi:unnamed protein product [Lasius platythorax]|uniref:Uncharacterized protein n=1 Tax=Lasius platythorax TaxID=488582 RepID=A0AAV2PAA6_9HYME
MWEHELPLSRTPTPAGRDSGLRPATRVTRLITLAIVLEEESLLLRAAGSIDTFRFPDVSHSKRLPRSSIETRKRRVYFADYKDQLRV